MTHDAYSTKRVTVWDEDRNGIAGKAIQCPDGYLSWCPLSVYQRDYQPITGMSFGHALHALKQGKRVCRAGWNGKGMWLAYTPGSEFAPEFAKAGHAAAHRAAEAPDEPVRLLPHIDMCAADGSLVIGWLASQTDMLADDWQVVGEI